ncbi:MAG: septum formation initiator family protein [Chloroflexi bacterium]|nr:septum formation initiator family protein [Chloroflexota bacterium]
MDNENLTEAAETPQQPRRSGSPLSGLQVMFAALLAISLILAINFTSRIAANQPLQEALQRVRAEIAQLRTEQSALIEERDYVQSDAYVESWARSEGKMIRPGEVLVIPVPAGGSATTAAVDTTATPSVPVQTTPEQPAPWMLWWALFFDTPPPSF